MLLFQAHGEKINRNWRGIRDWLWGIWIIRTSLETLWPVIKSSPLESAVKKEFEIHERGRTTTLPGLKRVQWMKLTKNFFVPGNHEEGGRGGYVTLWPADRNWWHHSLGLFSHCAVRLEGWWIPKSISSVWECVVSMWRCINIGRRLRSWENTLI